MPQENVESARRVLAALGHRDPEALIALAAPDVEWHSFFALGDVYCGYDGTRQYMRDLDDAWEIGRADVDDVLGVGDIGKADPLSGVPLIRFRAFREPEQALEAGLGGNAK
jgi:ketosteroid isomerase-like protein